MLTILIFFFFFSLFFFVVVYLLIIGPLAIAYVRLFPFVLALAFQPVDGFTSPRAATRKVKKERGGLTQSQKGFRLDGKDEGFFWRAHDAVLFRTLWLSTRFFSFFAFIFFFFFFLVVVSR